ncbi:Enoyl-(Acyl carrier protein) reductase [Plasmodiophora brassicae]
MATNLFDVSGKVAVVTGGARGIGAMICESLVANGADVVVVSRKAAGCAQFCDALNGRGHRAKATWVSADLSSDAECKRAADEIAKSHKAVHVLINNSGCNWGAPLDAYPWDAFDKVFRLNVFGVFALTKYLLPLLCNAGGDGDPARVINIGSVNGIAVPHLETYAYSTSKAALHHLTKVLASQLAAKNITVNAVAPGPFETDMMRATLKSNPLIVKGIPLRRLGRADDMAGAVLYLCSRSSAYVTGALLPVDGGALVSPKM